MAVVGPATVNATDGGVFLRFFWRKNLITRHVGPIPARNSFDARSAYNEPYARRPGLLSRGVNTDVANQSRKQTRGVGGTERIRR